MCVSLGVHTRFHIMLRAITIIPRPWMNCCQAFQLKLSKAEKEDLWRTPSSWETVEKLENDRTDVFCMRQSITVAASSNYCSVYHHSGLMVCEYPGHTHSWPNISCSLSSLCGLINNKAVHSFCPSSMLNTWSLTARKESPQETLGESELFLFFMAYQERTFLLTGWSCTTQHDIDVPQFSPN